jgi:hypothetical protein
MLSNLCNIPYHMLKFWKEFCFQSFFGRWLTCSKYYNLTHCVDLSNIKIAEAQLYSSTLNFFSGQNFASSFYSQIHSGFLNSIPPHLVTIFLYTTIKLWIFNNKLIYYSEKNVWKNFYVYSFFSFFFAILFRNKRKQITKLVIFLIYWHSYSCKEWYKKKIGKKKEKLFSKLIEYIKLYYVSTRTKTRMHKWQTCWQ